MRIIGLRKQKTTCPGCENPIVVVVLEGEKELDYHIDAITRSKIRVETED